MTTDDGPEGARAAEDETADLTEDDNDDNAGVAEDPTAMEPGSDSVPLQLAALWTRHGGPLAAGAAALFLLVTVGAVLLRPDPLALADQVREAAAEIADVAVSSEQDLADVATGTLRRHLADGRVDARPLEAIAGFEPDEPVVLAVTGDEARILVVLRDEGRHRLELLLLHDDTWRLDRFELY